MSASHAVEPVRRPAISNSTLAMGLFLFTEIMFFCALISGYLVLRAQAGAWPPSGQPRLPVFQTAMNTLILLSSAPTMWLAVKYSAAGNKDKARHLYTATLLLGTTFLLLQGVEWTSLVAFGLTSNSSLYGSLFYTLVGCHAVHVLAAVLYLAVLVFRLRNTDKKYPALESLGAARMYWLFVVAIWPPLYVLVYLT